MVKNCLICETPFVTYPCLIKQGKGKYCGRKCASVTFFKKEVKPWNKGIKMPQISGENHPRYKGWRYCGRGHRYRMLLMPDHPMADSHGYIREHRYVMSVKLNRLLEKTEEVHHIDGNGLNNNPDNLMVINKSDHLRLEHKEGRYENHLNKLHGKN